MRTPLVAGNWKMHLTLAGVTALLTDLKGRVAEVEGREILVCPAFPHLLLARELLRETNIQLGAQTCAAHHEGAHTGEVSADMLADLGCRYVLVGHSERRHLYGETDPVVAAKLRCALEAGLLPVLCVGENLAEREAGRAWEVVARQLEAALAPLDGEAAARVTVAYEPVWAIGTGRVATPEQAQEVHGRIRAWLAQHFDEQLAAGRRILYGGSVNAENIDGLMARPDVDGVLVGGASLKAEGFARIVRYRP